MLFESLSILCVYNNSRISFYTLILAFRFLHRSHFVLPIILVINLVDNAIKYGGDEPWVKVVFYRENWDWVLTVTDRGIGMPERVLKRIFRQFYRVKDKKVKNKTGFGLGLAFAKKVVNAYGGEIRVESAPGKGSRFEVRIKAE